MRILLSLMVLLWSVAPLAAQQLAFPTAEGFGRFASGGRGGAVCKVTNLATSGAGSFRACLEQSGARTIIFDTSGTINFGDTQIFIGNGDLTIAGQTAPGEGITIRGAHIVYQGSNIIIRHLRSAPGDICGFQGSNNSCKAFAFDHAQGPGFNENVILDHVTARWAPDDTIGLGNIKNATVQWSIIAEGLSFAQYGKSAINTSEEFGANGITWHHNLMVNNAQRHPRNMGGTIQGVNNVIYNGQGNTQMNARNGQLQLEWVANYYLPGPNSAAALPNARVQDCAAFGSACTGQRQTWFNNSELYFKDNFHPVSRPNNSFPETSFVQIDDPTEMTISPIPFGTMPAIPSQTTPQQAYTDVLASAGATVPQRDAIDQRSIDAVEMGTGSAYFNKNDPSQLGGYPVIPVVTRDAGYDTDGDGMPNTWEVAQGLNPSDPSDGPQIHTNGYSNLENFLNDLAGDVVPGLGPTTLFAQASSFTTPIPANHPADPNSAAIVSYLEALPGTIDWNDNIWAATIYNADDPSYTINVINWTCGNSQWGGCALSADVPVTWYQAVPTPTIIAMPGGSDSHVTIYDSTYVWDFSGVDVVSPTDVRFQRMTRRERAGSGVINPYNPPYWGSTIGCSGSTIIEGTITREEYDAEQINHAIHLVAYGPVLAASSYQRIYPCDGSMQGIVPGSPLIYGQRLQLNPAIDVSALPNLNNFERAILRAMQEYGVILSDANCQSCPASIRLQSDTGEAWSWFNPSSGWPGVSWTDFTAVQPVFPGDTPSVNNPQIYLPLQGDYNDVSGNGNNGTPSGNPQFGTAAWGTALQCDGGDDRVEIAADASFNDLTAYTMAACVNLNSYGGNGFGRITQWANASGGQAAWGVPSNATPVEQAFQWNDARYSVQQHATYSPPGSVLLNTNYHIAWTHDQATDTTQIYIDGVPVTSTRRWDGTGVFDPATGPLSLCNRSANDRGLDGFLGHFRVYNGIMADADIATLAGDCAPVTASGCPNGVCYVRPTGSDGNDCSDDGANACATWQYAINQAVCGDTIDGDGVFVGQKMVISQGCSSGSMLTIRGADPTTTVVDGDTPVGGVPWTLETDAPYTGLNVWSADLQLGRVGHMRNGATDETFRLISDNCMDGARDDCWGGTGQNGDWLLTQSPTAEFSNQMTNVNAWNASLVRYGTKANLRTYFRGHSAPGVNDIDPNTLDLRACTAGGTLANTVTITGNYVRLLNMTILGCRRAVYVSGTNVTIDRVVGRNNKQGFMTQDADTVMIYNTISSTTMPWVAFPEGAPVCGWRNETEGSAYRSTCALHAWEEQYITGEGKAEEARYWIENSPNVDILGADGSNQSTPLIVIPASGNIWLRNSTLSNCSSSCLTFGTGNSGFVQMNDNRFMEYDSAIATEAIESTAGSWYIYNNRFFTTNPYGDGIFAQSVTPGSTTSPTAWFYHNSFSGTSACALMSNNINKLPSMTFVNNILDCPAATKSNATLAADASGMYCFDHNWHRGGSSAAYYGSNNYNSTGTKAWDDTVSDFYPDPVWASLPMGATNSGLNVFVADWTCQGGSPNAALFWNSQSVQPTAGFINMGWVAPSRHILRGGLLRGFTSPPVITP